MRFLALETNTTPAVATAFPDDLLREEAQRVWELYLEGTLREISFRTDHHAAVILLECDGRPDAERIISSLPLVKRGLIRFEVIPLGPYPGFQRLFGRPGR